MTTYRLIPGDSVDLAASCGARGADVLPGPHTGDYAPMGFWVQNGGMPQPAGESPATTATRPSPTTPAVPKMGVRARVADWPPKREALREQSNPSPSQDTDGTKATKVAHSMRSIQNGQPPASTLASSGSKAFHRLSRRRSKDVEFQDGWPRSPGRAFLPLRHRSSSEITLSECDVEDVGEPRGARLAGALPLFREYGSTSSIDVQGVPEQSFFDILSEFRSEQPGARGSQPLPELFPADPGPHLTGGGTGAKGDPRNGQPTRDNLFPLQPGKEKERVRKKPVRGLGSGDAVDSSIFRKLRSNKPEGDMGRCPGETEEGRSPQEASRPWVCQKSFAHFDVQSMLFDLHEAAANRVSTTQRRNTTTGASAASATASSLTVSRANGLGGLDTAFTSTEDLNCKENLEQDLGDDNSNDLLLSCPHFRNEIGGERERNVSFSRASAGSPGGSEGRLAEPALSTYRTNASISVLEVPKEQQRTQSRPRQYSIEHVDLGARYYQDYFVGKEHASYFGVDEKLGPVAVSIKREKLEDHKDHGPQYQYRIIFRTHELITLRGSILEDATPTATKHGTGRGLPLKDALEYVIPELNIHCLRLALNTPKVTEQLLKLDEQGLSRKHKVGILYCRAGQSSEEEMYNNEEAGPAFEEFLSLLGEKVCLKGFTKYAAQLDVKTDSTGTHSLYTTYQDYEIMFHVSTLLPYTPNNRQQLLRKRHIGNDIVTIIFQEPGALPFTPKNIRSHFQHVFIIVRAHNPCTDNVCYSMAVTRSKDAPPFGPPIPSGTTFRKSDVFRDFLLAKVINAENAAHKSDKFRTMAARTRQEYLKDLAENCVSNTPIDSTGKFNLISLTSKKKEKTKARAGAEQHSLGAVAWRVAAQDYGQGVETDCILGISNEFVVLLDLRTKEVVFNCYCGDVIGWTPDSSTLKIFYGHGDHIFLRAAEGSVEDIRDIVQRLKVMTNGWETVDMTLRRNGLGQLGFHVKYDGTVAEVEEYGFAWQAGLRQGSRLVEICKVAVVTLTHDQMIDLLRTSVTVKVVIIPPFDDGTPRRGWPETYDMNTSEPKPEPDSMPPGGRPPYRSNAPWQWSGPASHNSLPASKWATPAASGHAPSLSRPLKQTPMVPFRESQPLHSKRPVSFPETPYTASPAGADKAPPYRQPSGSFSTPGSATYARYKPSPERYAAAPHPLLSFDPHFGHDGTSSGDSSSGGLTSQESTMERQKPEPLWHVPAQARLSALAGSSGSKHTSRQDAAGKDSPNRHSKGEPQYSSHSSSNTLSSNASSSHSDDRWFDPLDPLEPEQDPLTKGGSSDSGIDTTLYTSSPSCMSLAKVPRPSKPHQPPGSIGLCGGGREATGRPHHADRRREVSPAPAAGGQSKGYRPKLYSTGSSTPTGLAGGSRDPPRQTSDMNSRAGYPAQVYKTTSAETPRPSQPVQCSPFQLSTSVPKSFFSKQPVRSKHPTGWKRTDEPPPRPLPFNDTKKQVDTNTKNVFGQPRLRASLRDLRSPRKNYKSTIEDDLKKLIIMDNLAPDQERDAEQSPQKSLQRTLSDESLCSGRREPGFASAAGLEAGLPSDVLFTSTCAFPSSTLPARRQHQHPHPPGSSLSTIPATGSSFPEKKSTISASELSLADGRDRPLRRLDPGMMPLPDTAAGLEWSSLVNAAKAYEVQRAVSLFSLNDPALSPDMPPAHSPVHSHLSLERGPPTPRTTPTMSEEPPLDLTGKVYQLEAMLKQLHTDLQKEKQDKAVLQSEVASLRQNNQRLQEESQAASEQLRKFAEIFCREKKEL
ncbi:signal-induced proliferation-associated 1-like protein 3 isoform X1 [Artibeus jamaicensis]|uniref:signal-induced proliferation-associated 1-like protein 3 isoform X1 n=1 Tax=Artibeus jamaicensis TaxID=9417 RepID=UPI00235A8933|nr:signal-induced proliferation-associated 1-like protein 3 isoform X1 [Artibeus jamaicensis]XP_053523522.1 signal-induced proliferation-associated 1-like protein 3 isoform X1 [Artibeus jamaicensis]XP_053523523.1 signal-induced proliferation-associated 1-like protein 3 isoform X1 [Artibeus jamaicensis]XP_053523524.1 signal-induced proliferation-associated 1-like protein 3 isoform X1 [Artibeus jamaicensis]XP_053523525.1 signal-induced proliferation-associated 1-like protein 3 isoform X1 [Artibeu